MSSTEQFCIILGAMISLPGVSDLCKAFLSLRKVEDMAGDEFLVDAHMATFSVESRAVGIKSRKESAHVFLGLAAVGLLSALWFENLCLAPFIGLFVGLGLQTASRQMVPGCILVLGRSEDTTIALQVAINQQLESFRAISLLNVESNTTANDHPAKPHSFRLGDDGDWVSAVRSLSYFMPIIVLDIRDSSEYVEEEIGIILREAYAYKTIFITLNAATQKIVDKAGQLNAEVVPGEIVCVADDGACIRLIKMAIEGKAPSRATPLAQLAGNR
ncbi:MAG: hypothetical protein ACKO3T_24355 [Planctomycetaceae bacterium]